MHSNTFGNWFCGPDGIFYGMHFGVFFVLFLSSGDRDRIGGQTNKVISCNRKTQLMRFSYFKRRQNNQPIYLKVE